MATQVKHRRGNTSEISGFTPAIGELIMNTDTNELILGDGATQGGHVISAFDIPTVAVLATKSFKNGDVVKTKGYYAIGDGGGANYTIRPVGFLAAPGDIAMGNGQVAELLLQPVNDIRWWGAIGDFEFGASRATDTGTDNTSAFNNAILRLTVEGHPGNAGIAGYDIAGPVISLNGLYYGVSDTILVPNNRHGVTIKDGLIAALTDWVHSSNKSIIRVGEFSSGNEQPWQIQFENVYVNGRKRANCWLFDGAQKCGALYCVATEFIEFGFSTRTKSGELKLSFCTSYEYPFSEAGSLPYSARTGSAYLMRTADWIMTGCLGAVSKLGFEATDGYNWQVSNSHFWVGNGTDLPGTSPNQNTPLFRVDGARSGNMTNIYLDEGIIQQREYFDCTYVGIIAAQGTYGNTNRIFELIATNPDEVARDLVIDNVRSDRFVSNNIILYSTEGAGSWKTKKDHHVGNVTNGGNNYNFHQLHKNTYVSSSGQVVHTQNQNDAVNATIANMTQSFLSIGNEFSRSIGVASFASDNFNPPGFLAAYAPSGTAGDFSSQPLQGQNIGQFWATGSDGTDFGDSGRDYHGGGGIRIKAIENWTPTAQGTEVVVWATDSGTDNPGPRYAFNQQRFAPVADNTRALGAAAQRWSEVFAVNGTINTSDERAKTQIDSISDLVLDAWASIEKKMYKFIDAVESKGDKARWHFGVIAQDVIAEFERVGLNAFEYGILCFDEWEEQVINHPDKYTQVFDDNGEPVMVHAVKDGKPVFTTEKDFQGNEVEVPVMEKEVVKVADAYTETIPAGERYGIRYDQASVLDAALERRERKKLEVKIDQLLGG